MSLDDTTPTEYFGPHAKRWTNPDTGVTLSLSPRDYDRAVAGEWIREGKAEILAEAESAAWSDIFDLPAVKHRDYAAQYDSTTADTMNAGWPNVISMDTVYDRDLEPEASLFKQRGVLEVESSPLSGAGAVVSAGPYRMSAEGINLLSGGTIRFLSLSEDDTFGLIRPVSAKEAAKPAARHFKPRRWPRIAAALVLVYIIAVIGVVAVAGVMH